MKSRDIVLGLVIVVLLGGFFYWRKVKTQVPKEELKVPQTLSVQDQIEEKFNLKLPEDVDKAELKDVSGSSSSGIATRKFENQTFSHTVLADLPDPDQGKFYQGWLLKGEEGKEGFALVSSGTMKQAKGGWMIELQTKTNYSDYKKVVISLEEKADNTPEKRILEGSF
jgi:hypothetical protein